MYVVAAVQAETIQNALTVPAAAVLRDAENQPFVYLVNQKNEYGRRGVTLGVSAGGNLQIVSGVSPGDRVVGDGGVFLQFANSVQR
jgi:cobalt-zinc-cadmium efflux system membrane fusion protein